MIKLFDARCPRYIYKVINYFSALKRKLCRENCQGRIDKNLSRKTEIFMEILNNGSTILSKI